MYDFQTLLFERVETKFKERDIVYLAEDGVKRVMIVRAEKDTYQVHYVDDDKADRFVLADMLFRINEKTFAENRWYEYAGQFLVIPKNKMVITEFVNYEIAYVYPKLGAKSLGRVHNVFAAVVNESCIYYKTVGGYAMMKESSDPYSELESFKEKIDARLKNDKCTAFQLGQKPECKNMYFVPVDNIYVEWDYFSLRMNL